MLDARRVIWRFGLTTLDVLVLPMPKGARVLGLQVVRGEPSLYALVDPDAEMVEYRFRVFGTGHVRNPETFPATFIGTFQAQDGALVFHVFQE